MTDQDLDQAYSALCAALAAAGEDKAPLMLAMLSLSLMARCERAGDVMPLIDNALRQVRDDVAARGAVPAASPGDST